MPYNVNDNIVKKIEAKSYFCVKFGGGGFSLFLFTGICFLRGLALGKKLELFVYSISITGL